MINSRELLGAPRRTPGIPSPDGKRFVFTQSVYSFDSHTKSSEIVVCDFDSGEQIVVAKDVKVSQPKWLDAGQVVWLRSGDNGNTNFVVSEANGSGKSYIAGTVPGPISDLKIHALEDGVVAVAVSGQANPDGSLHNAKDDPKLQSSAKVYDATFVRHWDSYVTVERNAVFTAILKRTPARVCGRDGRYSLVDFTNALKGSGLECPIPPFGGTDHFDINARGLIFVAKDPDLNPATHTKCNAYYIARPNLGSDFSPHKIELELAQGAATCPVWASEREFVFLQMYKDGYESDRNHFITVRFIHFGQQEQLEAKSMDPSISSSSANLFDQLSPGSFIFSPDLKYIYAQAERRGSGCLWAIPYLTPPEPVRQLTNSGYITECLNIPHSANLLLTSNSLVDNSIFSVLNPCANNPSPIRPPGPNASNSSLKLLLSPSYMHNKFGLDPNQVSDMWWQGHTTQIHALVVRPSNFDSSKKYPLAYLIHGGPQGAWNDQWSTRWNPALFAEQGYVVIAPNPTGSTGYGQDFTDAICQNWGGSPYIDIEKGVTHIEENLPYIDTSRMVALGASYGGYMINWMAGNPLGKKFKTLVCHDGIFSMTAQLASEEQYFPMHDMGGPIWEKREIYEKWDPSRFVGDWETPMLIIHNELDYRLTVAEGLSAFNVLQAKGIESRFLTFSDEGHWVLKEENSLVWTTIVLNWCNRFVGLPEFKTRDGRNGDEYCRQRRRKMPSDQ